MPTLTGGMVGGAGGALTLGASDEHLRTLYVSNISPAVPFERLRELFSIFGIIQVG
jgi:hypothetical protein